MDRAKKKKRKIEQEYPAETSITECTTKLLTWKKMTDLTIIIGRDHLRAHRLILGMWSSYFEAMLFGPLAEGDTITLEDDNPQAFKWILNYMYKGQTELPSVEVALQVYLLADKYIMGHLKTVCSKSLIDEVTAESVPEVLNIATLLEDTLLSDRCAEVLGESPDSFFSSPSIGSLNSDSLKQLLSEDLPVSSESMIFKGILNWCRAHLKSLGKEVTSTTLRKEVDKFLPEVRFLTMSLEDFVKHVLPEHILSFKEVEAVQRKIAGDPAVNLTPLFSTKTEMRGRFNLTQLLTCKIKNKGRIYDNDWSSYAYTKMVSDPCILSQIKTTETIYLSKLEYKTNINLSGTLIVKDSSGQELQVVDFDGHVAEFERFKMQPEEIYSFSMHGSLALTTTIHGIADNGLISGRMDNDFSEPCVFHYWK